MRTTTALPTGALVLGRTAPAHEARRPPAPARPSCDRLTRPDLLERLRGVREDLDASLEAGEITGVQRAHFLRRIERQLLKEQAGGA